LQKEEDRMKTYKAMKVSMVGKVTEVVMGGRKHSGRGSRSRSYGSRSNSYRAPRFRPQ